MKTYIQEELNEILAKHRLYLASIDGGVKADLQWANLYGVNLRGANLQKANLREVNFRGVNLRGANLQKANLRGADLRGANLQKANLRGAELQGAKLPFFQIPEGDLIVYKKVTTGVIKLLVPKKAKRTISLIGRKCRAEYVKVLDGEGKGLHDGTVYKKGKIVRADSYDPDIRIECTHGIHFFLTKEEAEAY